MQVVVAELARSDTGVSHLKKYRAEFLRGSSRDPPTGSDYKLDLEEPPGEPTDGPLHD